MERLRGRSPVLDRLVGAVTRYRADNVEQWSLRVVNRGLFLAVSVMIVLLFVLERVTSQLPGLNEIVIPTLTVPASVDLGAVIHEAWLRQRGFLFDAAGFITLVFSAVYTAKSLRTGFRGVAQGPSATPVRWREGANFALAAVLAVGLLLMWLLTLATTVRTRAINTMLQADIPRALVNLSKVGAVLAVVAVVGLATAWAWHRLLPDTSRRDLIIASGVFAVFTAMANFVLFYAYIAALVSPGASGGVVLVFMMMAWVNAVARAVLLAGCWLKLGPS